MGFFPQHRRRSDLSGGDSGVRPEVRRHRFLSLPSVFFTHVLSFLSCRDGQVGGALARGELEFHPDPIVDRRNRRMGVHERIFRLHPQQVGTFRPPQRQADALVHTVC